MSWHPNLARCKARLPCRHPVKTSSLSGVLKHNWKEVPTSLHVSKLEAGSAGVRLGEVTQSGCEVPVLALCFHWPSTGAPSQGSCLEASEREEERGVWVI